MKKPFFSVIIPTYNRANLLSEAIQSVLNQTFSDYELIVVDDHSTDNTKSIVNSFSDKRIIYILNDRSGGGAGARNTGIFRARGEWIAFLDDDDVWLPEKLELLFKKIQEIDNEIGLIYNGFANYNFEKKKEISVIVPHKKGWIQKDILYTNYIGTFSAVSTKTALLKKIGGLDEQFTAMQDMELYVRIAGLAKIDFIKEKLSYIRQNNPDRISLNNNKKLNSSLLFYQKHRDLIKKSPRIRHRIESLIFINALRLKNLPNIYKYFLWTVAGIFFDTYNFLKTTWAVLLILSKYKKEKIKSD